MVNPAFPGWRDDLAIMVDEWGCAALRLFPSYHGYRLTDPRAEELLRVASDRGLPLIVSVCIGLVRGARISEQEQAQILGDTAGHLLSLRRE